jgi:hypothetical protein
VALSLMLLSPPQLSFIIFPPGEKRAILQGTKGVVPTTPEGSNSGAGWREFEYVGGTKTQNIFDNAGATLAITIISPSDDVTILEDEKREMD